MKGVTVFPAQMSDKLAQSKAFATVNVDELAARMGLGLGSVRMASKIEDEGKDKKKNLPPWLRKDDDEDDEKECEEGEKEACNTKSALRIMTPKTARARKLAQLLDGGVDAGVDAGGEFSDLGGADTDVELGGGEEEIVPAKDSKWVKSLKIMGDNTVEYLTKSGKKYISNMPLSDEDVAELRRVSSDPNGSVGNLLAGKHRKDFSVDATYESAPESVEAPAVPDLGEDAMAYPTASAMRKAVTANDEKAYQAFLMQREAARQEVAKVHQAKQEAQMKKQAAKQEADELAAYRDQLLQLAEQTQINANRDARRNVIAALKEVEQQDEEAFKSASSLSDIERRVVSARLAKISSLDPELAKQYVALGLSATKADVDLPEFVQKIASNSQLDVQAKADILGSMFRTSSLTSDQRSKLEKYWVGTLGYPKEYVDKMVADVNPVTGASSK